MANLRGSVKVVAAVTAIRTTVAKQSLRANLAVHFFPRHLLKLKEK